MSGSALPGWLLLSAWVSAGAAVVLPYLVSRRRGVPAYGGRAVAWLRRFAGARAAGFAGTRKQTAQVSAAGRWRGRPGGRLRLPERGRLLPAASAGLGTAVVFGGGVGCLAGLLLGAGLYRWLPRPRSPQVRRAVVEQQDLATQLPMTAELLAACLSSCSSPAPAVAAVGRSVGPPMARRLEAISAELALGAPPELSWGRLGDDCPTLAPLGRCLVRTSISGAPPAAPLRGLAQAQRASAARAAQARVRRAGVIATAPLGVCFLPAFILISVVPVVLGLTAMFAGRI